MNAEESTPKIGDDAAAAVNNENLDPIDEVNPNQTDPAKKKKKKKKKAKKAGE